MTALQNPRNRNNTDDNAGNVRIVDRISVNDILPRPMCSLCVIYSSLFTVNGSKHIEKQEPYLNKIELN